MLAGGLSLLFTCQPRDDLLEPFPARAEPALPPNRRRWLRFDDGNVMCVSQQAVLTSRPYLLFYQRV